MTWIQGRHAKDPVRKWVCVCVCVCVCGFEYKYLLRASLGIQRFSVHLAMQGTLVRSLVQEDPTCHGAPRALMPQQKEPPR